MKKTYRCEKVRGSWKINGEKKCSDLDPCYAVPSDAKVTFRSTWRSDWKGPETIIFTLDL